MNFDNIPAELKARSQWVVWRAIVNENGKVDKPLYQAKNPQYYANVGDPKTWATFEEALACHLSDPTTVNGIGFVFSSDDEYFGVDIDNEAKVDPSMLEARRGIVSQIVNNTSTYAEVSPSGTGLHIIGKGRLPAQGRRSAAMQLEVYDQFRFFTMTGNVYNGRTEVKDEQELVDFLFKGFFEARQSGNATLSDLSTHRRLDLSDEEVIREASNLNPMFAPRFNCQTGCEPGQWSETFMMVIGVLDQITGKVDQLKRIVLASPMVNQAPPSAAGEPRSAKAERNFNHVLGRVRDNNTRHMGFVEHGRSIVEAIKLHRATEAKRIADEIMAKASSKLSRDSVNLLKAFPINPKYLDLAPPPGIVGRYAQATAAACYNPFLKFSIPATLAVLSGILGRAYKLPNGAGLNSNYILAAPTATGKTQTMQAWEQFLTRASRQIGNTIQGPSKTRLIKAAAASIQGVFAQFMENPSGVWFISECASQLSQMSMPKTTVDGQLRDAYNDLYDSSKMGSFFSLPYSTANRKAELTPIENLSISTYWTTTVSKFEVFNDDAQDGFLSRVTVIRHTGAAGEAIPDWELKSYLDDDLQDALVSRLNFAKQFDEAMILSSQEAAKMITTVQTSEVDGQMWAFRQIAERIKNASLDGSVPVAYTAVSRLPVTALRIAAVLAVMENPYSPSVTIEQFEWSFGYLLQNLASLLSDMDQGELGASMSKDITVVVKQIKRMLAKDKELGGVKRSELVRTLRNVKPFKDTTLPGEVIRKTLAEMHSLRMIDTIDASAGTAGRPFELITPTSDDVWL